MININPGKDPRYKGENCPWKRRTCLFLFNRRDKWGNRRRYNLNKKLLKARGKEAQETHKPGKKYHIISWPLKRDDLKNIKFLI